MSVAPSKRRPRVGRRWRLAVLLSLLAPHVHAEPLTLFDAWQLAREHDPTFQAAQHDREAGLQSYAIGRSYLLPKISGVVYRGRMTGDRKYPLYGRTISDSLDSSSSQDILQMRQPIYNHEAFARFRLGRVQADYAEVAFAGAELDLVTRLATAYLNLMLAQDLIDAAKAQLTAYEEHVKRATASFQRGEGTRTDVSDAESRASLARADLLDATDNFAVAQQSLQAIIGEVPPQLPTVSGDFTLPPLDPPELEHWMDTAKQKSPRIVAERLTVEAARHNVSIARAGFLPSIELTATTGKSESDSTSTVNQTIHNSTVGVQMTMPLFAGGGVKATADQAVAKLKREQSTLEATINDVLLEVRKDWQATTSASARIAAYQRAADSAALVQRGVDVGIRAGTHVAADALDATRLLYVSRRDLAKARYEYVSARLRLLAAAGVLTSEDVQVASDLFH